jgi:site-specific recombinase XerC
MPRKKLERRGEKPQWRARLKTWTARIWEADGTCSGRVDLGTSNREIAFARYERWLETGTRPKEASVETFAQAAERVTDAQLKRKSIDTKRANDRRGRLRRYALPRIGMVEVAGIEAHHVASVLDKMSEQDDKSAGTILAMRSDISQILAALVREGTLRENCARSLAPPKEARTDTRRRLSLTDEQVLSFQKQRGFKEQVDLAVLFCRQIAGHRTSDIFASRYEHCLLPCFSEMKVRRPKTDGELGAKAKGRKARAYELITHEVAEEYRAHLQAYWRAQGSPAEGPIFPTLRDGVAAPMTMKDGRVVQRRATKAGEHKKAGSSFVKVLRRAVWGCGIYQPLKGFNPNKPDKALCGFQTDTDETRRLDFHSFRGSLVTALASAGVELVDQLGITGHTQLTTQLRHYMEQRRVKVPRAALPGGHVEEPAPAAPALSPALRAELEALLGRAGSHPEAGESGDRIPQRGRIRGSRGHLSVAK